MIHTETELAEHIMIDLVRQGYSGKDLHEQFKKEVDQIHLVEKERLEKTGSVLYKDFRNCQCRPEIFYRFLPERRSSK